MNFFAFIVLFCGLFAAGTCYLARTVKREDAQQGKWSWLVSLREAGSLETHYCGGTLIAPQYVLTNLFCTPDLQTKSSYTPDKGWKEWNEVRLRDGHQAIVGDYVTSDGGSGEGITISAVIIPPNYKDQIALLKLSRPVTLNENQSILPLANRKTTADQPGKTCSFIGWPGNLNPDDYYGKVTGLQHLKTRIEPNAVCDAEAKYGILVRPDKDLCVLNKNTDNWTEACHGNSGSPVVCTDSTGFTALNSVFNRGDLCGTSGSILPRVSYYADFLQCAIGGWQPSCAFSQPPWVQNWRVFSRRGSGPIEYIKSV